MEPDICKRCSFHGTYRGMPRCNYMNEIIKLQEIADKENAIARNVANRKVEPFTVKCAFRKER